MAEIDAEYKLLVVFEDKQTEWINILIQDGNGSMGITVHRSFDNPHSPDAQETVLTVPIRLIILEAYITLCKLNLTPLL